MAGGTRPRLAVRRVLPCFPLPSGARILARGEQRWLPFVFGVTALMYLLIAFAGVDTSGGKSLGPRLLLPLHPLLSVSAVMVIASYLRSSAASRPRSGVGRGVARGHGSGDPSRRHHPGLPAAERGRRLGGSRRGGVAGAHRRGRRYVHGAAAVSALQSQDRAARRYDRVGGTLGELLAAGRTGALLVSRNPPPAVSLPPLRMRQSDVRGRMVLQEWSR